MSEYLLFDGGFGTMLQKRGLAAGELPELLNLTNPNEILSVHKEYVAAGANVITANTFGANRRKLGDKVGEVISAAISIARASGAKKVALDIGPTGALLEPLGTLSFDEAYEIFKEMVIAGSGADIIAIETMADMLEAKAALLAAKENSNLPVFVTMTFAEDGRTFLGTTPKNAAITLSSLGADAVGINCSLGPAETLPLIQEMAPYVSCRLMAQPNAGLPKIVDGSTVYTISPDEFASSVSKMLDCGVEIVGGCCGTTPDHIKKLRGLLDSRSTVTPREIRRVTAFTSAQNVVILDKSTAVIGERINPTGKKRLKEALRNRDFDYVYGEAFAQQDAGADLLDVNAGLPEIDEKETLVSLVKGLSGITALPLQIDSSDPGAIEAAVRIYNGKPIINSVNGKAESMDAVLPIVKKYGCAVVALTLDEDGIPETAEKRFAIAKKICDRAVAMGIPKEDILVDTLTLTASTNQAEVMVTLDALKLVKERLGLKTVLGVSNVSFGLPMRERINSTFLAAAFGAGLDMPILNPLSQEYMNVVAAFKVLNNEDAGAAKFIENNAEAPISVKPSVENDESLIDIIVRGERTRSAAATRKLLENHDAFDVINNYFIPALDAVGDKFNRGDIFLPQLMASAETVKAGFDVIKSQNVSAGSGKGKILVATVKGDIHDIGKNIVRMLLENYGYNVVDLGRDVEPQKVVDTVREMDIKLVGLSALMTTTVKAMKETIDLIHENKLDCKIMVGGAVLNPEYAEMVGADFYAKDAMQSAQIAGEVLS